MIAPLISIIIPTYNSVATLSVALDSIVNQTFKNWEVFIMDGASVDTTLEIATKYQEKFPHKIYMHSEKDSGIYDAMNKGIDLVNGEWLYFMGSDDSLYETTTLEKILKFLKPNNYDVIYGNVTSPRFGGVYDDEFTHSKLINKNICHQAIFLNKVVFKKIGNFNLKYKSHADWDHNIRWFFSTKISKKHANLIIANYADGGYSSLNEDLEFKNYLKQNYPLISICIPTYNGQAFLVEAMESAINQTYPNLEIVVSDDASKDTTLNIIEAYKDKTSIPIYIFHHEPNGIGANWNNSVRKANGEYIKFLFQDDVMEPTCIEKMVHIANMDKNIGMVYCERTIIYDEEDNYSTLWIKSYGTLHNRWKNSSSTKKIVSGKYLLKDEYLLHMPKNKFGEPTALLIKKDVFKKIGYFDEQLKQLLDLEFWYRILKFYNVGFVNEKLVSFRLHSNQATQINKDNQVNEIDLLTKICYKKFLWQGHPKTRLFLFKKHNSIVRMYRFIRNIQKK